MTVPAPAPAPDDREGGIILVIVALSMTVLMMWAALVLDGGEGYATRRQMQNAADSAVLAGTQALRKYQLGTGSASNVYNLAHSRATDNGADSASAEFVCTVVQSNGLSTNLDGDCTNAVTLADANSAGISVTVERNRPNYFGQVFGQAIQIVRAHATATIQPLYSGPVFFWLCGAGAHDGGTGYDLLDSGSPYPTIDVSRAETLYGYNTTPRPAAVDIQSNKVPNCGSASSSADGKDGGQAAGVGTWTPVSPGNGSNVQTAFQQVVSATPCPPDGSSFNNCDTLIPIVDSASGTGSGATVRVVAWTVWHIQPGNGNTRYQGWFDGPATISGGPTSTGACTGSNATCAVKLIV